MQSLGKVYLPEYSDCFMKVLITNEEIELIPIVPEVSGKVVSEPKLGRPENSKIPELVKDIVSIEGSVSEETQSALAKVHGITQTSVSYLSRGLDRSNLDGQKVDQERQIAINDTKFKIQDRATTILMTGLNLFDPGTLEQKYIPGALKNISAIVKDMGPAEEKGNQINFIVMQPRMKQEEDYQVIEVTE